MPDLNAVHEGQSKAEFVVVQEAYAHTATTLYADVLLPATTWAEKVGTVTNSERRISKVNPAIGPYESAKHDWQIALEVGRALEALLPGNRKEGIPTLFPYAGPEDIWNEHRDTTQGRDLDITGLTYDILERQGPQQWPMPKGASIGLSRLYMDGKFPTASGKAQLMATPFIETSKPTSARYPFTLNTGRLRDQWHGMSRTGLVGTLFAHVSQPFMDISAKDAYRLQLEDGDLAHITSHQGSETFPIKISDEVAPSQVFIPMHWGSEFISGNFSKIFGKGVNGLTSPLFDPVSEQPELKYAAVKIIKAELPWQLVAFGLFPQEKIWLAFDQLKTLYGEFGSAYACLFGREQDRKDVGILFKAAHFENPYVTKDAHVLSVIDKISNIFELSQPRIDLMGYQDKRLGVLRMIRTSPQLQAVLLAGTKEQLVSTTWLRAMMDQLIDTSSLGRMMLAPTKKPPMPIQASTPPICNCYNVSAQTILEVVKKSQYQEVEPCFEDLQQKTQCGSNCGSCKPEIKRMIQTYLEESKEAVGLIS
jgi:assimilatory nitrate reductase catalytic subunit